MNRYDELRRYTQKDSLGIEIAPFFNPTLPKSDGYNVLVVDVFDTETLRKIALDRPQLSDSDRAKIEEVDVVCDASRMSEAIKSRDLAGEVTHIVSSHNFEHLPDPISFLKGCFEVLAPGGMLSMALPDCRACFDHFRMPTRLSDWLGAYHRGFTQPSPEVLFDNASNYAPYLTKDGEESGFNIAHDSPKGFTPARNLKSAYESFKSDIDAPGPYRDAHCSVFFGPSLELMLEDLRHLGLIDFEVVEISRTIGIEFFIHLRKPIDIETQSSSNKSEDAFYARRHELLTQVNFYIGSQGLRSSSGKLSFKKVLRVVLGDGVMANLSLMNARRRAKRTQFSG